MSLVLRLTNHRPVFIGLVECEINRNIKINPSLIILTFDYSLRSISHLQKNGPKIINHHHNHVQQQQQRRHLPRESHHRRREWRSTSRYLSRQCHQQQSITITTILQSTSSSKESHRMDHWRNHWHPLHRRNSRR